MSERYFCPECKCYHDRSNKKIVWFDIAGGCLCAFGWMEQRFDENDQQFFIDLAWLDLAYKLDIFDNLPTYSVTHLCGCVTTERSPTAKDSCYQCLSQRTEDRYNG